MSRILLHASLLAGTAGVTLSAPLAFTDRTVWAASGTVSQTLDFEGIAPPNSTAFFPLGLSTGAGTFTGTASFGADTFAIDQNTAFNTGSWPTDFLWAGYVQAASLQRTADLDISFVGGVLGFGTDYFTFNNRVANVAVTLVTTQGSFLDSFVSGGSAKVFRGYTAGVPGEQFISAKFRITLPEGVDGANLIDDFAVMIPEPASLLLIGTGVTLLGLIRRRK